MKSFPPWGRRRLSFLLEAAASREARTWAVYVPKKPSSLVRSPSSLDTDVSPAQRDEAVRWLTELHDKLQLYPETLVLAVSVLDRFLAPIKARPKYLRCIAVTSFFLAAKICEEDECVPPLKELAASSRCGCSPSEILRMERIILDKLNWDLHTATALDFLHIFHATAASCRSEFLDSTSGLDPSQHLALLTRRLYTCLADHTLLQLRGSTLALALLTLELETCCPDWLVLTIDLLRRTQIDSSELIRSRELVARSLSAQGAAPPPNTVYIYQPRPPSCQPRPPSCCPPGTTTSRDHPLCTPVQPPTAAAEGGRSFSSALLSPKQLKQLQRVTLRCKASTKRKVEQMDVDDFYDGIKRLYNEDPAVQEGSSSPCPPLQPVGSS